MKNISLPLNEPYEITTQQPYNLPNININIKNKEYKQNNNAQSEKISSNKSSEYFKKSDDYDSLKEYKNIFLNQKKNTINICDYTNNQYQSTNALFFKQ